MKLYLFIAALLLLCFAVADAQETEKPKAGSFRKPTEDAQKSKNPLSGQFTIVDDGCPNPFSESQTYSYRYGKIFEITSDNKIIVKVLRSNNVAEDEYEKTDEGVGRKLKKPQLIIVSLVGIDEGTNQSAIKNFLLDLIGQEVTLVGNTRKDDTKKIDALVQATANAEIGEISQYLLENGMAKFKDFQLTNIVPMRTACALKKAETKAREAKLGIWAQ